MFCVLRQTLTLAFFFRCREIIRGQVPSWAFHILNWTFISFIQSILLFALAAPAYIVLLSTKFEPGLTDLDMSFLSVGLGLIVIEIFADQEQWGMSFHYFFKQLSDL